MNRLAAFIYAGSARNQQDNQAVQIDAHPARKGYGLGIVVRFVEHTVVRHGSLLDGRTRYLFEDFRFRYQFLDFSSNLPQQPKQFSVPLL